MTTPSLAPPRVRTLSPFEDYACGRSGLCCRLGWTIPLEPAEAKGLSAQLLARNLRPPRAATSFVAYDATAPHRLAFAHDARGACVWLDPEPASTCAIHRQLGHEALPMPCRQFPRVAVLGEAWVDVTLSSVCPTVAARLVSWPSPLRLVVEPRAVAHLPLDGLDTRGHVQPLLRPGVVHSPDSWERLLAAIIRRLDGPGPVTTRLDAIESWCGRIGRWTPADGPTGDLVAAVVDDDAPRAAARSTDSAGAAMESWHAAWDAVPPERARRPVERLDDSTLDEAGHRLSCIDGAIGRYLAAYAFASWIPWMATRTTTLARALRQAWHVLIVESAIGRTSTGARDLVTDLGRSDLLLRHLAEADALTRRLERP